MYGKKDFLCPVKSKCLDSRETLRVQGMLRVSSVCDFFAGFWRTKLLRAASRMESHIFYSEVQNESSASKRPRRKKKNLNIVFLALL